MYRCSGRKSGGKSYCKNKVSSEGGFCSHHINQKDTSRNCKCFLDSGNQCPLIATVGDFCEYHEKPSQCESRNSNGVKCGRIIPEGTQCRKCKNESGPVLESVKGRAESIRLLMMKQTGKVIVPASKVAFVPKAVTTDISKLVIPDFLKAPDIEKPSECPICYSEFEGSYGKDYRRLQCGHYFHIECISRMYESTCPMCRTPINESYLPKWVSVRIDENRRDKNREDVEADARVAIQYAMENDGIDTDSYENIEIGTDFLDSL